MIHVGIELKFIQVLNVLEVSVIELSRNKSKLLEPDVKENNDRSFTVSIKLLKFDLINTNHKIKLT